MLLCFGFPVGHSVWSAITSQRFQFTSAHLVRQVIIEILKLVVVFWIGTIRGWSFRTFGTKISLKGTLGGVLLFVIGFVISTAIYFGLEVIHPEHIGYTSLPLALPAILLVSIINPVFEETLESGYFIHSLQRFGIWIVLGSAFFRAVLHIYEGFNAALSISSLGLIFAFTYWRWRQLWPLIVAHSLADLCGFLIMSHHAAAMR